jgi:ABC-type glutathione transport system ATPase component
VTSLVGPSGSGKSTLAKSVIGLESSQGEIHRVSPSVSYSFVDHLFRSSYNADNTVEKLITDSVRNTVAPSDSKMRFQRLLDAFNILYATPVSSLLESQRKTFEIILSLSRTEQPPPYLIVLDEYLDKDIKSVRNQVYKNLLVLCADDEIQLQVLLITHSKSTQLECSDYTVVMHDGRVYAEGPPSKVQTPSQMAWLM